MWKALVDRSQMTIMFHINDLLLSHVHSHVMTDYVKNVHGKNSAKDPLAVDRSKLHLCLGMTLCALV